MLGSVGDAHRRPIGWELADRRVPRPRPARQAGRAPSERPRPVREPHRRCELLPERPPARLRHDEAVPARRRSRVPPAGTPSASRRGRRQPRAPAVDEADRGDGRGVGLAHRRGRARCIVRPCQEGARARRRHRPTRPRPLPRERAPTRQRCPPRRVGPGDGARAAGRREVLGARGRQGQEHPHLRPDGGRRRPAGRRRRRDRDRGLRRLQRRPPPTPAHHASPHRRGQRLGQVLERLGPGLADRERRQGRGRRRRAGLGPLARHERDPLPRRRLHVLRNSPPAAGTWAPRGGSPRGRARQRRLRHPRPVPRRLLDGRQVRDAGLRHERGRHLDGRSRGRGDRKHGPPRQVGRDRDRGLVDANVDRPEQDLRDADGHLHRALDAQVA